MGGRAVFLDRDGVLLAAFLRPDGRPRPAASPEEFRILPGVREALGRLREAGYRLVVVTNQPDVARGTAVRDEIDAINGRLRDELELDAVYTCFHDTADRCDCRKPKPGLLLRAAREMDIDFSQSAMVGDRWSDVEAGRAAGCRLSLLIDAPYSETERTKPDAIVRDVADAADVILHASEGEK